MTLSNGMGLLRADGKRILRADGKLRLTDGTADENKCCCGPGGPCGAGCLETYTVDFDYSITVDTGAEGCESGSCASLSGHVTETLTYYADLCGPGVGGWSGGFALPAGPGGCTRPFTGMDFLICCYATGTFHWGPPAIATGDESYRTETSDCPGGDYSDASKSGTGLNSCPFTVEISGVVIS